MKPIWHSPFYLIFFALYPVFTLWANNIRFVPGSDTVRSIIVSLLLISLVFILFGLVTRDWNKAAILAVIYHGFFFVYGHIHTRISGWMIGNLNIGRQRYFMIFVLSFLLLITIIILRAKFNPKSIFLPLNIISMALLVLPIYSIITYQKQASQIVTNDYSQAQNHRNYAVPVLKQPALGYWPDVYYIILDSYTRADVLEECFGYNNQPFLERLTERGFYVATNSQTNFTITDLSMAASLNMEYPQNLGTSKSDAADEFLLEEWVKNNTVRESFKKAGYRIIGFETGYGISEWKNADRYFSSNSSSSLINPYESMLLSTTMMKLVYDTRLLLFSSVRMALDTTYMQHRSRMLNIMDNLDSMAGKDSPKFVFAHLLAPHSPFVFGKNGEFVIRNSPFTLNDDPESKDAYAYKDGYVKQVEYLNQRMIEMVDHILNESENPPIIIIQGDHGASRFVTSKWGRSYILNAYYLPSGKGNLYETISPVNSFRIIFSDLFGVPLEKLSDEAFYTTHSTLESLKPIIGSKNKCNPAYLQ